MITKYINKNKILAAFVLLSPLAAQAEHIPIVKTTAEMSKSEVQEQYYQHDAARKRYADIYKISAIIDEYIQKTGHVPIIEKNPDPLMAKTWEVTLLGQKSTVEQQYRDGTPFMVSLRKFRAPELITVLEEGLGRPIDLPIDPQNAGTVFPPVYYVWVRPQDEGRVAYYVVSAFFYEPVKFSASLAAHVNMVGLSNQKGVAFHVPAHTRAEFSKAQAEHILKEGQAADSIFGQWVPLSVKTQ